jgi:hypothetical protein
MPTSLPDSEPCESVNVLYPGGAVYVVRYCMYYSIVMHVKGKGEGGN